ncbi:hypothetical protein FHX74_003304 [Friedmanniella endophytica]|uniref:Uncharacterized protein n=1 Tax=Microlunatus kandeliicorticis TaxID=1759536 RepID=A0A7W3IUT2_9ACTN|nr:glycosyltransferase family 2 protein [Microlunatus kandeliicorticis]MBA8795668.1 hypothetical protein [Microlunatus kandeliicorticis]
MRRRVLPHLLFAVLLVSGAVLRWLAWTAYRPAILYIDSFRYLYLSTEPQPDAIDPLGYPLILAHLLTDGQGRDDGTLASVAGLQHLLGLGIALALYLLLLRIGVRPWLAALGLAPFLLDAYQVQIEEMIMSETWFLALLTVALWLLLAGRGLSWWRAGLAGAVIGAAMFVRIIGGVAIVPVLIFCLTAAVHGRRLRAARVVLRTGLAALAFGGVVLAYAHHYKEQTGHWGLTTAHGNALYGRAASIADCDRLPLDPTLRMFCPVERLDARNDIDYYANIVFGNDYWPADLPAGADKNALARQFAITVMTHQPVGFFGGILGDFAKNFSPWKITFGDGLPVERWQFQTSYPYDPPGDTQPDYWSQRYDKIKPSVDVGIASFLRSYQLGVGHTPGPALAVAAVLGVVGGWPRRERRRPDDGQAREVRRLTRAAALTTGLGLTLLFGADAFEFSWRYQIPGLLTLPLGGALGLSALLGRRRARPPLAPFPDPVDAAAVTAFDREHPGLALAPVAVVIAAYNEGPGIGPVLTGMPARCVAGPVSVLVVVDGASDDTAAAARAAGALVADVPVNRGQGAALRLGYRLAARYGASLVVTTDADGQYDIAELDRLLAPIVEDRADFVTGSRRLGSEQHDSRVRWLGVRVFAVVASVLTRRRITDTSFGFRAMRTSLVAELPLREPQYQSSELLLRVIGAGARVVEVPSSMRLRSSGASKKGGSLVYGANYARVMLGTWARLGRRRRSAVRRSRPAG